MHPPELGEIVGQSIWDLLPADQKKISRKSFLAMIESGHEPPVVVRSIYTTDGEYRTYELHRSLMRNDQGAVLGMRYVGFDASEAHAALHKSEQARMWIEGAYAAMAEAVVVTDTLGTICMINRAAEELLGWKSAELVGKMLEEQLRLASPSSAAEGGLDHRAALTIRSTGKATVLDGNRRPVRLELSASPIVDTEKGFTVGVVYELRRAED
jgi:PAS domain S-box-containing protein